MTICPHCKQPIKRQHVTARQATRMRELRRERCTLVEIASEVLGDAKRWQTVRYHVEDITIEPIHRGKPRPGVFDGKGRRRQYKRVRSRGDVGDQKGKEQIPEQ